jgi:hypothetical protein
MRRIVDRPTRCPTFLSAPWVRVSPHVEAMIKDIGELTVDVDGDAQMRIRCE